MADVFWVFADGTAKTLAVGLSTSFVVPTIVLVGLLVLHLSSV